jgi:hypothetical protein
MKRFSLCRVIQHEHPLVDVSKTSHGVAIIRCAAFVIIGTGRFVSTMIASVAGPALRINRH